ncbi:MAG TPA: hypothetical protein DCX06_12615 [Opitutae bacterium]|nr:hypothetical protein [Opitutae bacterium]
MMESVDSEGEFSTFARPVVSKRIVRASPKTSNNSVATLIDGKLVTDYGPVFKNRIPVGMYKMDLGASQPVYAITSWSYHLNGTRGPQLVTVYGSSSDRDPGWGLQDAQKFEPLGTIDLRTIRLSKYTAVSLVAAKGLALGDYRWIVWETAPVTKNGEHTAFQELSVL